MFEKLGHNKTDEIIDTFNKYRGLLSYYTDDLVLKRTNMEQNINEEDEEKIKTYKQMEENEENGNYEAHLQSKIFEGVLVKCAKEIFGDKTAITPTSEYDDWVNATDMVLEAKNENGKIARIAIDATFCKNTLNIQRKNEKILDDVEHLNEKGPKEKFCLKYFSSPMDENRTREFKFIPRVILGAYSGDFKTILEEVKTERPILTSVFLKMIKSQLENQFILALRVNGEKMDLEKQKKYKRGLSKNIVDNIKSIYPLSQDVVDGGWDEDNLENLFALFEKNETLFSMRRLSIPEYALLLSNIKEAWKWTKNELVAITDETKKNNLDKMTLIENNEVVQKLESHIESERVLKHRPIFA